MASREIGQRRKQHGQDHDCEVFDQRDADHDVAVRRAQFSPVGQEPGEHHGAGDGNNSSDGDSLSRIPAHQPSRADAESNRKHDPQRAAENRHPLHLQKLAK